MTEFIASLDAVLLARIQFAFTISFHFIFPAFTIGLASYLAVVEGLWLATGNDKYYDIFKFWLKIFAVTFAMGVVSGIVMSYQFGTNWSVFSDKTGPILGPLMGYEVLTAFFLEAGFLGIMLFGLSRVGKPLHFAATCIVAVGTVISAFWILSVNSWMHTPAGYSISAETGQFMPEDWWAIVFNPSFPYRFVHTIMAAYLTTAFIVGGVGAYHLLRDSRDAAARTMFSMAMWMAVIVAPLQIVAGDLHGLNTLEHQPMKVAAMEGQYKTERNAPLRLFGFPNDETETVDYEISIPGLQSFLLKKDFNAEMQGLDSVPKADRPNTPVVFWSFRVMVGIGVLMVLTGVVGLFLRWRGRLYTSAMFHRWAMLMAPSGLVAVLAGWFVTEIGRQPYTVHGLLRTAESIAPIGAPAVAGSLLAFIVVYTLVFGTGIVYLLRLMVKPTTGRREAAAQEPIRSAGIHPGPAMGSKPGSPVPAE